MTRSTSREGCSPSLRSKFGKSRQIPLHPTTVEALASYGQATGERRNCEVTSFFTSSTERACFVTT